jgi:hypothetical protein
MPIRMFAGALALVLQLLCGPWAAAPPGAATVDRRPGGPSTSHADVPPPVGATAATTVRVTIPELFTLSVLSQTSVPGRCTVVLAVTDTRLSHPGFTVVAAGGGAGSVTAVQVPGNRMLATDVRLGRQAASYRPGLAGGSVRIVGTFTRCPSWTLL